MHLLEARYSKDLSSADLQDLLVKIHVCGDGSDEEEASAANIDIYRLFWDGKRMIPRHYDYVDAT